MGSMEFHGTSASPNRMTTGFYGYHHHHYHHHQQQQRWQNQRVEHVSLPVSPGIIIVLRIFEPTFRPMLYYWKIHFICIWPCGFKRKLIATLVKHCNPRRNYHALVIPVGSSVATLVPVGASLVMGNTCIYASNNQTTWVDSNINNSCKNFFRLPIYPYFRCRKFVHCGLCSNQPMTMCFLSAPAMVKIVATATVTVHLPPMISEWKSIVICIHDFVMQTWLW